MNYQKSFDFIILSFDWRKDGQIFDWKSDNRIIEEISKDKLMHTLTFNFPKSSDAGIYQCLATNKYGIATGEYYNVTETAKNIKNQENVKY